MMSYKEVKEILKGQNKSSEWLSNPQNLFDVKSIAQSDEEFTSASYSTIHFKTPKLSNASLHVYVAEGKGWANCDINTKYNTQNTLCLLYHGPRLGTSFASFLQRAVNSRLRVVFYDVSNPGASISDQMVNANRRLLLYRKINNCLVFTIVDLDDLNGLQAESRLEEFEMEHNPIVW